MIYSVVPFTVTLRFQGHGIIRPINVLDVLCVQLTRDLFAIAKLLYAFNAINV